jgi:UDP-glucose 4-epimerase
MDKILVTGGYGFIGRHLVEALAKKAEYIDIVDNLSLSDTTPFKGCNPSMGINPYGKFWNGQVASYKPLRDYDCIYHFAGACSVEMYKKNPFIFAEEIRGFINIMEIAKNMGCKVIFPSTGSVPPNLYADCKYAFENIAENYAERHGVQSKALRIFASYGPGEAPKNDYASVITLFAKQMIERQRPVIWGDGTQARDFIYIDDVIKAITYSNKTKSKVFDVGSGKPVSFNRLIAEINKALSTEIKPEYKPLPKGYVDRTKAHTAIMHRSLCIECTSLKQGIANTIRALCSK